MQITSDCKQRIKVILIFMLQIYKVLTGTMLVLFIPQECNGEICSIKDNYEKDDLYHKLVFYWNSLTLLSFLFLYSFEIKREEWCVKYLDIDNNYSDNFLKTIIIQEKELDNKMDNLNKRYYQITQLCCIFYSINISLMVHILYNNYHSNSTVSCFLSFTLLVCMKLYNSINVGYQSVKNDKMTSAYISEFVSYNVFDKDYILDKYNGHKNQCLENVMNQEDILIEERNMNEGDILINNKA